MSTITLLQPERLPETVPVLEPHHIHKGAFDGPNDTHCLLGWFNQTFPYGSIGYQDRIAIEVALRATTGEAPVAFNDNPRRRPATIARRWNQFTAKLGYVKGNPEAKPKKR